MDHLLDSCPITSSLWDSSATIFRRAKRVRGQPHLTIKAWDKETFKNPVIRKIWLIFLETLMWEVWKERNGRVFERRKDTTQLVWNQVVKYIQETIKIT